VRGEHDPDEVPFDVGVRRDGPTAIVAPDGEVDLVTVHAVRQALESVRGADTVVIDLRAVRFLDTSGLQLVVEEQRRSAADGFDLVVVRGPERVQRLFDVAGVTPHLTLVEDPEKLPGRGRDTAS
jgi:anti-sigma B factor antagonist